MSRLPKLSIICREGRVMKPKASRSLLALNTRSRSWLEQPRGVLSVLFTMNAVESVFFRVRTGACASLVRLTSAAKLYSKLLKASTVKITRSYFGFVCLKVLTYHFDPRHILGVFLIVSFVPLYDFLWSHASVSKRTGAFLLTISLSVHSAWFVDEWSHATSEESFL